MGNLPSTSGRVTQVAHEATQSSGGPVVVGKPGDPPARPGRIIWRIVTAGSQVTEDPHGTIVYLPGHLPKKSSTKCLGKYTMNGSYGQVFSNYGWFTFPFQMACINCINGLYMGVILTTYKSWDPPSMCSPKFAVNTQRVWFSSQDVLQILWSRVLLLPSGLNGL